MKLGLPISFVLHGAAIFGGMFVYNGGIKPMPETRIIPIELVSVAEVTNIRAAVKAPDSAREKSAKGASIRIQ